MRLRRFLLLSALSALPGTLILLTEAAADVISDNEKYIQVSFTKKENDDDESEKYEDEMWNAVINEMCKAADGKKEEDCDEPSADEKIQYANEFNKLPWTTEGDYSRTSSRKLMLSHERVVGYDQENRNLKEGHADFCAAVETAECSIMLLSKEHEPFHAPAWEITLKETADNKKKETQKERDQQLEDAYKAVRENAMSADYRAFKREDDLHTGPHRFHNYKYFEKKISLDFIVVVTTFFLCPLFIFLFCNDCKKFSLYKRLVGGEHQDDREQGLLANMAGEADASASTSPTMSAEPIDTADPSDPTTVERKARAANRDPQTPRSQ